MQSIITNLLHRPQFFSVGKVDTIKNYPTKQHYRFIFGNEIGPFGTIDIGICTRFLLFDVICVGRQSESSLDKSIVGQTVNKKRIKLWKKLTIVFAASCLASLPEPLKDSAEDVCYRY